MFRPAYIAGRAVGVCGMLDNLGELIACTCPNAFCFHAYTVCHCEKKWDCLGNRLKFLWLYSFKGWTEYKVIAGLEIKKIWRSHKLDDICFC